MVMRPADPIPYGGSDRARDDFERESKTLLAFVGRYLRQSDRAALNTGKVRVVFLDYDWSLNGR